MDKITYTGTGLNRQDNAFNLDVYTPSAELTEAVNLAILLKRPLLLMGEPGCGKTRLAESVAVEIHKADFHKYFFRWDIKSTSKAKDGIYQYDALKRMYDANTKNVNTAHIKNYITRGKLANALTLPQNGNKPNILLIDEIDKADIDFPNDLLLEIETGEFEIPELQEKVSGKSDILIFITSNRERELPQAFLRRCLYFYINFPQQHELEKIVRAKFKADEHLNSLVSNAVTMFFDVRNKIEGRLSENDKKPSTSELLEWFTAINHHYRLKREGAADERLAAALNVVENYKQGTIDEVVLPFPEVLLKTWETVKIFKTK